MVLEHLKSRIFRRSDIEHLVLLIAHRYTHRALTPLMRSYEILGDPGEGAGKGPRSTLLITTLMTRPYPDGDRALLEIYALLDPEGDTTGVSIERLRDRLNSSPFARRVAAGWELQDPELLPDADA